MRMKNEKMTDMMNVIKKRVWLTFHMCIQIFYDWYMKIEVYRIRVFVAKEESCDVTGYLSTDNTF